MALAASVAAIAVVAIVAAFVAVAAVVAIVTVRAAVTAMECVRRSKPHLARAGVAVASNAAVMAASATVAAVAVVAAIIAAVSAIAIAVVESAMVAKRNGRLLGRTIAAVGPGIAVVAVAALVAHVVAVVAAIVAAFIAFVAFVATAPRSGPADRVRGHGYYPDCRARAANAAVVAAVSYLAAIAAVASVAAIVAAVSAVVAAIAIVSAIRAERSGPRLPRTTATTATVVAVALAAATINASGGRVRSRSTRPGHGTCQPRQVALSIVGLGVCVCDNVPRINSFPRCPWDWTRRDTCGDRRHGDSSLPKVLGFIPEVPAWRLPCGEHLARQNPCRRDRPCACSSRASLRRETRRFPAFCIHRNHGARQTLTLAKL